MEVNDTDERVLVLAPIGQDAKAISQLLARNGIKTEICRNPAECVAGIVVGAGTLLLTEEALELERACELLETGRSQRGPNCHSSLSPPAVNHA